jgi:hypothetical protein
LYAKVQRFSSLEGTWKIDGELIQLEF